MGIILSGLTEDRGEKCGTYFLEEKKNGRGSSEYKGDLLTSIREKEKTS